MNATIYNKDYPERGRATIPLPIPDEEYAQCLEQLEQLGIGGVTEQDCTVESIDGVLSSLKALEGQTVNVDELDVLAHTRS